MMFNIKILKYAGFVIIALAIMVIPGCFISSSAGTIVSPEVRAVGLPDPAIVGSVTLKVTGPDMDPVEVSYSEVPSVINISIPEGLDRTFELTVGLTDTFVSNPAIPYTSYKGKAVADITSDSAVVTLTMGVGSTKIVVPDFVNSRLLQFNDMTDPVATVLDSNNTAFNTFLTANMLSFGTYDVDFDKEGRIYIAENGFGSGQGVIRVDNILGTNPVWFGNSHAGIITLTVDRTNNLLYYSNGSGLYRSDLDGAGEVTLTINTGVAAIQTIEGITMDDDGYLYLTGTIPDTSPTVFKYDPAVQTVLAVFLVPNSITNKPWDVLAKDGVVYITNPDGPDGWKIMQLNSDLTSPVGYGVNKVGVQGVPDTSPDHFYSPRRFVAVLNKKIAIVDDEEFDNLDKLVSIDDISGSGWQTLPVSGDGQSLFSFFYVC